MYGGKIECSRLWVDFWKIVELAAKAVYYAFPDRVDRRLSIGDATCTDGDCPGHPTGSHGPWPVNKLDLNYYTFGPNNTTQYRPGSVGDPEYVVTEMWNPSGGSFGIEDLKTDVFDWERNYVCWRMIREAFPGAYFMISDALFSFMYPKVAEKYGSVMGAEFVAFTITSNGMVYNHHTHVHVDLGREINFEMDIAEAWRFLKE